MLTEYERQREERIARNNEKMRSLNLPGLAAELIPKPKILPKKPAKSRKKQPWDGPRRSSKRLRQLADGQPEEQDSAAEEPVEVVPRERHPQGPLPFESLEEEPQSDKHMLSVLQMANSCSGKPCSASFGQKKLHPRDCVKLTQGGIVQMAFHGASGHALLAAADKQGHIGLWHVDDGSRGGAAAEDEDAVALEFAPHKQFISGFRWARQRLVTASYDGSVRVLDPEAQHFALAVSRPDAEFSAMDCSEDGNIVYLGDVDGDLEVVDIRDSKLSSGAINVSNRKLNCLNVEPGTEREVVASCGDGQILVFDVRRLGKGAKPVATANHLQTCQSAFFAPDGSRRVVSTSRDNTVRVWLGGEGMREAVSISHNNNTGRWISPFRAVWAPNSKCIAVGSMTRMVDLFSDTGKELGRLGSELHSAISPRISMHPTCTKGMLAAATGSGRVYLYR